MSCKSGIFLLTVLCLISCNSAIESPDTFNNSSDMDSKVSLDLREANRLSKLAFHCIGEEYPNKLGQVLGDSSYLGTPKALHPAFYGCFDWHSAVHGHWSLVRLLKSYPDLENAAAIRDKISSHITPENMAIEVAYFDDPHNRNYERTYGWAWLLKLAEELYTWNDPQAQTWYQALKPLEELIVSKYLDFLPKLTYPIRVGEHSNTAFGLTFAWDFAHTTKHQALKDLIEQRAKDFYLSDRDCPVSWEPSGFDFLSPCLEEADIMSRVLPEAQFDAWLQKFIRDWSVLTPAQVSDRQDGKLVHLDGLNFSRAWVLYNLARRCPSSKSIFAPIADKHLSHSLPTITTGNYAGQHWLASFALFALDQKDRLSD